MTLFALTEKERDLLQAIVNKVQALPPKLFEADDSVPPDGPAVYVAKPTAAIPSLTPAPGTAEDDFDVPGSQTCDIYQIVVNNSSNDPELLEVEDFTLQKVYNLSQKAVPAEWILVQRTKFGNWIAIPIDSPFGRVTGTLTAALGSGDSDFEIDNVVPISGTSPLEEVGSASETLTVDNVFGWDADDNARVNAEFNKTSGDWEAYQITCPA